MKRLLLVVATAAALIAVLETHAAAQSLITVVSPHAGERVGLSPYYVRWSASAIAGNTLFIVHYIDGAGEVREICSAPAAARECLWNEPDWFATTLSIDARNSSGVTLATSQSGAFVIEAENLPARFYTHLDIGKVGRSGGGWGRGPDAADVRGAGGDIWGTADAFHFNYTVFEGGAMNATFTISGLEGLHPWTKVGVMVRDSATPGAPHHSVFASRDNGVAYQRRLTYNGTSLHTPLSASSTLPVQVQVMRRGTYVVMDVRRGTGAWERAAQFRWDSFVLVGMAVTSHDTTRFATGSFTGIGGASYEPTVQILSPAFGETITAGTPYTISWTHMQPVNISTVSYSVDDGQSWTVVPGCASITATTCRWNNPGPVTEAAIIRVVVDDPNDNTAWNISDPFAIRENTDGALPTGWVSGDVGAIGALGSASYNSAAGRFVVAGSGADIWGTADEFHYASRTVYDDGEFGTDITARVASVENVNAWTKAGLMLRQHRGAGAAHVSLFVTPTTLKGVALQRRTIEGATSLHTAGPSITAPVWLKFVVRRGAARAYYRTLPTDPWTFIAEQSVAIAPPYEAGLAVSSHVDGRIARATFDNVSITSRNFEDADIGAVGIPGTTATSDVTRSVQGSGADIWGTADAFRYHYGSMEPSGVISARVTSLQPTNSWAKAGVMIRQDISAGSPHVMLIASPGKGIAMQYRALPNGPTANVAIVPGAAPVWLRLTRRGGSVLGEASNDGVSWRDIGRLDIALGQYVTAGIVVTSHVTNRLAKAEFEDVVLQP
jgi:hypothetical protein